jgi:hypothetical protein
LKNNSRTFTHGKIKILGEKKKCGEGEGRREFFASAIDIFPPSPKHRDDPPYRTTLTSIDANME